MQIIIMIGADMKVTVKWILKEEGVWSVDWIQLAQNRRTRQRTLGFHKGIRNYQSPIKKR
jgi:hypothetical protein